MESDILDWYSRMAWILVSGNRGNSIFGVYKESATIDKIVIICYI